MLKPENDVCMMLSLVVVCQDSSLSMREATTASGVDNAASPDWQTPLTRLFHPRERLITMQKQLKEPRSILMSSR